MTIKTQAKKKAKCDQNQFHSNDRLAVAETKPNCYTHFRQNNNGKKKIQISFINYLTMQTQISMNLSTIMNIADNEIHIQFYLVNELLKFTIVKLRAKFARQQQKKNKTQAHTQLGQYMEQTTE